MNVSGLPTFQIVEIKKDIATDIENSRKKKTNGLKEKLIKIFSKKSDKQLAHPASLENRTIESITIPMTAHQYNRKLTADYLEMIKKNSAPLLQSFCINIPGVELHVHLDGALWAEDWWNYLKENNFYLKPEPFEFYKGECKGGLKVEKWSGDEIIREKFRSLVTLKEALSPPLDNDSTNSNPKGNLQSFFRIWDVTEPIREQMSFTDQLLPVIKNWRGVNGLYQEVMIELGTPDVEKKLLDEFPSIEQLKKMNKEKLKLEFENFESKLSDWINAYVKKYDDAITESDENVRNYFKPKFDKKKVMGDFSVPITSVYSPFTTKIIIQIMRTYDIALFIAALFAAVELLRKHPDKFVGINVVGPEHENKAIEAFKIQHKLLKYLYERALDHQKPNFTLHTGELSPTATSFEVMKGRIRKVALSSYAKRIGHGCCLGIDNDPQELLSKMNAEGKHMEICLESNKLLLGLGKNDTHPFSTIIESGVPFTLCTDDPGPLRTNKMVEFIFGIKEYNLNWDQIVRSLRDGLEFSFLRGESIWRKPDNAGPRYQELVPDCAILYDGIEHETVSKELEFFRDSEKAYMQWRLEKELVKFEADVAVKFAALVRDVKPS